MAEWWETAPIAPKDASGDWWSASPVADAPAPVDESRRGGTAFLNQGIASSLGMPVDLLNGALGYLGLGTETPFGGSKSIASGLEALGIRSAPQGVKPETMLEAVSQGVGGASGGLLPGAGIATGLMRSASPVAQGVGSFLADPFIKNPLSTIGADFLSGAGFGAGEYATRSAAPESPGLQTLGGLVGGVAGGMTPAGMFTLGRNLPMVSAGTDMVKAAVVPFTEAGARSRARSRVQGMSEDPAAALRSLQAPTIANLSPAARTGDPRLMQLEQAVRRDYAPTDMAMREAENAASAALRQEAMLGTQGASIDAAKSSAAQRIDSLTAAMDARVAAANESAAKKVAALEPRMRQSQASTIVRQELEAADAAARAQQNAIWAEVPSDVSVPTGGIKEWLRGLVSDLPKADRDKVPAKAMSIIGRQFKDNESVREVHALYSDMREVQRNAMAGDVQNRRQASIAGRIAEQLLKSIDESAAGSTELRAALDYSRKYNQTFRQGDVGRILGNERTGADRVAPIETLDRTVGRPGLSGVTGYDSVARALAGVEGQSQSAIGDYVLSDFNRRAVRNGEIRPDQARSFLRDNPDMMDRLPNVNSRVAAALTASDRAKATGVTMGNRAARVTNPDTSAAARLAQSPSGREVDAILTSPDPSATAAQLMRQARGDEAAKAGLKSAFVSDLLAKGTTNTFDSANQPMVSGRAMIARLDDPAFASAAKEVLGPEGVSRARQIAGEFAKIEQVRNSTPAAGPIMGDEPNSIISYMARVMAARMGASAGTGGASLQTAQMASARMKRILQRLTNDKAEALIKRAIEGDTELFESLLTPVGNMSKSRTDFLENAIVGTSAGVAGAQDRSGE